MKGLTTADRIVVRGLQRVRPGASVAAQVISDARRSPAREAGRGEAVNFARFFVDRPIFAGVLSMVIFVLGVISAFLLPISEYPEVVPPTVVVRAQYPGASPKTIAETVAAPLEQEINGVEDMLYMNSSSNADGTMTLTATFRIGANLDLAQVQVQNRVAQALAAFAGGRASLRRRDAQELARPDHGRAPVFARQSLRRHVHPQLRGAAGQRHARAHPRHG